MKLIFLNCAFLLAVILSAYSCRKPEMEVEILKLDTIATTKPMPNVQPAKVIDSVKLPTNLKEEKLPDTVKKSSKIRDDSSLLAYYDFDSSRGKWYEDNMLFNYTCALSSDIKKKGKSLKIELHKGDGIRAEFGTDPNLAPKEGWFGFSVFFPANYENDKSIESIVQFQALPDFHLGESWRSAPLYLGVLNGRTILEIRTDANKVKQQGKSTFERIDLGPITKNEWSDFVFHINWAHNEQGTLELWKNNKLIYSRINKQTAITTNFIHTLKSGFINGIGKARANLQHPKEQFL